MTMKRNNAHDEIEYKMNVTSSFWLNMLEDVLFYQLLLSTPGNPQGYYWLLSSKISAQNIHLIILLILDKEIFKIID